MSLAMKSNSHLLLVWACVASLVCAQADEGYSQCYSPNDCTDPKFPICSVLFTDLSFNNWNSCPVQVGVCVECAVDCDCPVNMYCGKDYTINSSLFTSTNSRITGPQLTNLRQIGQALNGTRIKSKCKNYDKPLGEVCNTITQLAQWSDRKLVDGYGFTTPRGVVYGSSHEKYCGRVEEYIPELVPQLGMGVQSATGDALFTPGQCFRAIYDATSDGRVTQPLTGVCAMRLSTLDPRFNGVYERAGVTIVSEEPQWEGHCRLGRCQICKDGETRCATRGERQLCIDGVWVRYLVNDWSIRTLPNNIIAQLIVFMFCCVLWNSGVGWAAFHRLVKMRAYNQQQRLLRQEELAEAAAAEREAEENAKNTVTQQGSAESLDAIQNGAAILDEDGVEMAVVDTHNLPVAEVLDE